MPNIVCPDCSTETFIDDRSGPLDGTPEEFCRICDYPLFWVSHLALTAAGPGVVDPPQPSPLRRYPGTEGIESTTAVTCPVCRELNSPERRLCWRCRSELRPIPHVPVEPVPVSAPEESYVPPVERYWDVPAWILITLGVILAILIVITIVAIV